MVHRSEFLALVKRNRVLKWRKSGQTIQETLYPVYIVAILIIIKVAINPDREGRQWQAQSYSPLQAVPTAFPPSPAPDRNIILCSPDDDSTKTFVAAAAARVFSDLDFAVECFPNSEDLNQWVQDPSNNQTLLIGGVSFESSTDTLISDAQSSSSTIIPFDLRFPANRYSQTSDLVNADIESCRGEGGDRTVCPVDEYITNALASLELGITTEFVEKIRGGSGSLSVEVQEVQQPTSEAFVQGGNAVLDNMIPIYTVLAFFPVMQFLIVNIVTEKEQGRKVYLSIVGTSTLSFWLSWSIVYMFLVTVGVVLVTIMVAASDMFPGLNGGYYFIMLFFFGTSLVTLGFAVSTFFSKAKLAGTVGSLLFLLAGALIFAVRNVPTSVKYLFSLLSPCAVTLGINYVNDRISRSLPINFFEPGEFSIGSATMMMLLDTALYIVLTWYFDQVIPMEYGVSKKWYFIFQRKTYGWGGTSGKSRASSLTEPAERDLEGQDNDKSSFGESALVVSHLSKTFISKRNAGSEAPTTNRRWFERKPLSTVTALDDVSFAAQEGEILGLLGHNGAGKSTLINILSGLFKQTAGTAELFSMNIEDDMDEIRRGLGIVPQSNSILNDELTCTEHVEMIAGIKGMRGNASELTRQLLVEVGLEDAMRQRAKSLSGGQKRKLLLAMSLVGNPKILILDEHSAGVDVFARRSLWKLLQRERERRVTLVASHFLDEVEVLCDRVVLLEEGRIRCQGTPLHLKAEFNIAYRLSVTAPIHQHGELTNGIRRLIPEAVAGETSAVTLTRARADVHKDDQELGTIAMDLPWDAAESFPMVFRLLENREDIADVGLALPTLEEVFRKIEQEKEDRRSDVDGTVSSDLSASRSGRDVDGDVDLEDEEEGVETIRVDFLPEEEEDLREEAPKRFDQFRTLWRMTVILTAREGLFWFWVVALPLLFLIIGLVFGLVSNPSTNQEATTVVYDTSFSELAAALGTEESQLASLTSMASAEVESSWAGRIPDFYPTRTVAVDGGLSTVDDYFLGRLSDGTTLADPVVPSGVVVLSAGGDLLDASQPASIELQVVSNFSYTHELLAANSRISSALLRLATSNSELSFNVSTVALPADSPTFDVLAFFAGLFIILSFTVSIAAPAISYVKERSTGLDHALRMAGAKRSTLLLTRFAHHLMTTWILYLLSVVVIVAFRVDAFIGVAMSALIPGVLLYGLLMVLHTYAWSFAFNDTETVTNLLPGVISAQAWIPYIVIFNLSLFTSFQTYAVTNAILLVLLPPYGISSLLNFLLLLETKSEFTSTVKTVSDVYSTDAMVYPALIAMAGHILIQLVLIYYLDVVKYRRRLSKNKSRWVKYKAISSGSSEEEAEDRGDMDVQDHRSEVHGAFGEDENGSVPLNRCAEVDDRYHIAALDVSVAYNGGHKKRADGAKNCFGAPKKIRDYKIAVKELTLGVEKGERIALLGPNGAGKTSLLSVLTGAVPASGGRAYLAGHDIEKEPLSAYRNMGYTAQHDRLWEKMTMREHLELFAVLHGAERRRAKALATQLMEKMRISEYADKWSSTLSGGTKRKLSLALGTIGAPSAQLHDEPSTGLDVVSQRKMWDAVLERTTDSAAIISTHNMTEASVLCNVVVIMTNGSLQCIGHPQRLLHLYGKGYVVELIGEPPYVNAYAVKLVKAVFPDAELTDAFGGRARFRVMTRLPHVSQEECEVIVREVHEWPEPTEEVEDSPQTEANVAGTHATQFLGSDAHLVPSFATIFSVFNQVKDRLRIEGFPSVNPTWCGRLAVER
uniref:Probable ATP-dependent transporter ycf16 n=1 Tax=Rhodosorus marinus TaxID=101924 RepID=A0A7S3E738_9RHOD|mmetsp:Transcript_10875/g.45226  ORF Transcript_10875/g.45226 Transcript_10875/m.45226 type:complete len:1776 (+) Transcript_10875:479-5806(+)